MFYKNALGLLASAAILLAGTSAQAVTLSLSPGQAGPGGETTQGLYSDTAGATTIDFNSGVAPTTGFAVYSGGGTITSDEFAPFGPGGAVNTSPYLTFFQGSGVVEINFATSISYFGFDWGFIDGSNTVQIFNGSTLLASFTGADAFALGATFGSTAFANFTSSGPGDTFNRIVLLEAAGGGFESDNHAFVNIPEPMPPTTFLALLLGVALAVKLRSTKQVRKAF